MAPGPVRNADRDRALGIAFRASGGRVVAALAARFRDLDLAEDAFAEACARALVAWEAPPADPAAWLYAAARRAALDTLRQREVRARLRPDAPPPAPTPEDPLLEDAAVVPDERLRLILICCHPAVAVEARAALTLRMVCGLSTPEIARAFLVPEPTLAQRLVRAKRKIAEAGVPFGLPARETWPERMEAVLSTLEVAYAFAYGDAAGAGPHADFAGEMMGLTALLAKLAPEPEVLAFAALVRLAEARRPARLDETGAMVPLSEQDVTLWRADLLAEGERMLGEAARAPGAPGPRALQAAIHAAHASRHRSDETPWRAIVGLYEALMQVRPSPVTAVNRAVAVGEAFGAERASPPWPSPPTATWPPGSPGARRRRTCWPPRGGWTKRARPTPPPWRSNRRRRSGCSWSGGAASLG